MSSWQWFALTIGYGSDDTYGPIITTWRLQRRVRLMNISTMNMRKQIVKYARSIGMQLTIADMNCDDQYSGGSGNSDFHDKMKPLIDHLGYQGTYINADESDEDCEGATEIVLNASGVRVLQKM